jgi:hypothetical protein
MSSISLQFWSHHSSTGQAQRFSVAFARLEGRAPFWLEELLLKTLMRHNFLIRKAFVLNQRFSCSQNSRFWSERTSLNFERSQSDCAAQLLIERLFSLQRVEVNYLSFVARKGGGADGSRWGHDVLLLLQYQLGTEQAQIFAGASDELFQLIFFVSQSLRLILDHRPVEPDFFFSA